MTANIYEKTYMSVKKGIADTEYLEKLVTNICEINNLNDLKEAFDKDYISHFGKTILKWNK